MKITLTEREVEKLIKEKVFYDYDSAFKHADKGYDYGTKGTWVIDWNGSIVAGDNGCEFEAHFVPEPEIENDKN